MPTPKRGPDKTHFSCAAVQRAKAKSPLELRRGSTLAAFSALLGLLFSAFPFRKTTSHPRSSLLQPPSRLSLAWRFSGDQERSGGTTLRM